MTKYFSAYSTEVLSVDLESITIRTTYSYVLFIKHGAAASRVALVSKFEPQHFPACILESALMHTNPRIHQRAKMIQS
jgi:hypothetical protein